LRDTNANTTDVTNTDSDSNGHSNCDGNSDCNRNGHSNSYCNSYGNSHSYVDPCANFDSYGNCNRYRYRDTDSYCKTFPYAKIETGTKASADRASAAVASR
jgi:hypothetical protein